MDTKLNGYTNGQTSLWPAQDTNGHASSNEILIHGLDGEPSIEELEHELPVVGDGQFEMRELLSRVVQSLYAELTEMAETYVFSHHLRPTTLNLKSTGFQACRIPLASVQSRTG